MVEYPRPFNPSKGANFTTVLVLLLSYAVSASILTDTSKNEGAQVQDRILPLAPDDVMKAIQTQLSQIIESEFKYTSESSSAEGKPKGPTNPPKDTSIRYSTVEIEGRQHPLKVHFQLQGSSGGILIISSKEEQDKSSFPTEFVLKFTILFKNNAQKGIEIDNMAIETIRKELNEALGNAKFLLATLEISKIKESVMTAVMTKLTMVNPVEVDSCKPSYCLIRAWVQILPAEKDITKTYLFEILVTAGVGQQAFHTVRLQLGGKNLTLKIPLAANESHYNFIIQRFQEDFSTWCEDKDGSNFIIDIVQAHKIVNDQFKKMQEPFNQCYEFDAAANPVPKLTDSQFQLSIRLKRGQASENGQSEVPEACKTDPKKQIVSQKLHLQYFSYQFGGLDIGHLYLDHDLMTTEYIIDLKDDKFKKSIEEELNEFVASAIKKYDKEPTITEVKLETLANEVKLNLEQKVDDCAIKENIMQCKKGAKLMVQVEYSQIENNNFKIQFFFPSDLRDKGFEGKGAIINQLIVPKFNSYSQIDKVIDAVKKYAALIKL